MRQYRKKIRIIAISFACLLFAGTLFYKEYIRVQNIFDQMFYTRIRTNYDWWGGALGGGGNKSDSFGKMLQTERISRDEESFYTNEGFFENRYKSEYLREGERLSIEFTRNTGLVKIYAEKQFNEFDIVYRYSYDIKTKCLQESVGYYGEKYSTDVQEVLIMAEESGLSSKKLLEYKQYFLYNKLLTDWLDVNNSRFSIYDWGNVEYIEVLPLKNHQL